MKLVPLGDKIVLRRDYKVRYRITGTGEREAAGGRSYRCRTWR